MKRITFLIALTIVSLSTFAQTVTVFDPYNTTKTADKNKESTIKNNLQWNYSLLSRGAFALTYERKLNEYIGAEVGAGLTIFNPSILFDAMSDDEIYYYGDNHEFETGSFFSIGAKIYPKQMEDFEGVYAYPVFRIRTYKSTTTMEGSSTWDPITYTNTYPDTETFKLSERDTDLALMIGYQAEGWNEILYNSYIGFGYTSKNRDVLTYDDATKKYQSTNITESTPNIFFGMSIGFTF